MATCDERERAPLLDGAPAAASRHRKASYNSISSLPLQERSQCGRACRFSGSVSDPGTINMEALQSRPRPASDPPPPPPRGSSPLQAAKAPDHLAYTWFDLSASVISEQRRPFWRRCCDRWRRRRADLESAPPPSPTKAILRGVSGAAYPGELLAIMGASGAGKTTLLNALMFRSPPSVSVHGHRAINGFPVTSNMITALTAYVQQDDVFIGTLTVREHLIFQALVRMDRHIPYDQRMKRVDEVITELSLTKCQNTTIGIPGRVKGISGGEKKRLSFACEVLTDPPLMFCDEPTSGLDSFMAQNVVLVLKNMALKGKTVVCTIHQPSSEIFALFDKILLMSEGRVAYLGSTEGACNFFKGMGAACPRNYNPADFFVQLLAIIPSREETCKQTIELVCDAYQRSEEGLRLTAEVENIADTQDRAVMPGGLWGENPWQSTNTNCSPYKASWFAQFQAVLWRSWLSVLKEPMLIRVRLLQTVMVSILVGLIYFGQELNQDGVMNINGALFIFLTNMTFQNVFAVISVFCSELPIFMREHFNGMYRTDVYFLCKTIAEIPIFIAIPVIFTSISYYLVGFNPAVERFFIATAIVMLVANVATSFGYLISCVSKNISMALSIGPPVVIPFLLFGGFFLNTGSVPDYFKWLSYLSWFRYGNEALLINQWKGVEHIDCSDSNSTCPRNGKVILDTFNFAEDDFTMDISSLFGLIFCFRFMAYLALLIRAWRSE